MNSFRGVSALRWPYNYFLDSLMKSDLKKYQHHTVYKLTVIDPKCRWMGRYYVGRHSSNKPFLETSYYGSGSLIRKIVQHYGKQAIKREVLRTVKDPDPYLYDAEQAEIRRCLGDEMCLNNSRSVGRPRQKVKPKSTAKPLF